MTFSTNVWGKWLIYEFYILYCRFNLWRKRSSFFYVNSRPRTYPPIAISLTLTFLTLSAIPAILNSMCRGIKTKNKRQWKFPAKSFFRTFRSTQRKVRSFCKQKKSLSGATKDERIKQNKESPPGAHSLQSCFSSRSFGHSKQNEMNEETYREVQCLDVN